MLQDFSWTPPALLNANWATDAAFRNGFYYWYVSVGGDQVAVVRSSGPAGPWEDPLGTFLLPQSLGQSLHPQTCIRVPSVLQDDGRYYIVFGACR